MSVSCAGSLFQSSTGWKLKVGVYETPIATFTLDDLRSSITVPTRKSRASNYNKIVGTFKSAAEDYATTDFPAITSDAFLAEDNGVENQFDLALPLTTSSPMAQRLAKQALFKNREQISFSADFSLRALLVEVGDVIALDIAEYGFTNKEFEVTNWALFVGETGALRVALDLQETSEAVFDWNAEEATFQANNTNLPDPSFVPTVGISTDAELRLVNETVVGALIIDVTSDNPFADAFEVQYKRAQDANYVSLGRATSTRFEAVGIEDGLFDVRARAINGFGINGAFTTINDLPVSVFEAPPDNVQNFSANIVGSVVQLSWAPVTNLDLSHYRLRFNSRTSGANYQDAVDLIKKIPRPGNSVTVPAQTGTYFIKAVDKLGTPSDQPARIVIDATLDQLQEAEQAIVINEHPDFAGTLNDLNVRSGRLTLRKVRQ